MRGLEYGGVVVLNLIVLLIVSAAVGFLAGKVMHSTRGVLFDCVAGLVGGFIGPVAVEAAGVHIEAGFSAPMLVVQFLGTIAVFAAVNYAKTGKIR